MYGYTAGSATCLFSSYGLAPLYVSIIASGRGGGQATIYVLLAENSATLNERGDVDP